MSLLPKTKHDYIGIEIECISKYAPAIVALKLKELGLEDYVTIDFDGSIDNPDFHEDIDDDSLEYYMLNDEIDGYEFCLLCKQKELPEVLNKVDIFLADIEAYVNEKCGLHVHIDIRNKSKKNVIKNLLKHHDKICLASYPTRLEGEYCVPLNVDERRWLLNSEEFNTKYKIINPYTNYNTIEIRSHEGTVDTKEILGWCNYLIEIAYSGTLKNNITYYQKRVRKVS